MSSPVRMNRRTLSSTLCDLIWIATMLAGFYLLAVKLELSERIGRWTYGYEYMQLDELPLTLLMLSAGLAWFGWRRWRELAQEMDARQRIEESNLRMLEQNRQLSRQLIHLQEQERRHLASELHDEIGQCCVAIKVDAASIAEDTRDRQDAIYANACAITETADHLHGVIRNMLHRLRPTGLDDLGLTSCLKVLVDTWSQRHGIACGFTAEGALDGFGETTNIAIYRTVQESLTNIARHAQADRALVAIRRISGKLSRGDHIHLLIEDTGIGMPLDCGNTGFGLLGMSERVNALGGSFSISNVTSGGTRIEAAVPVRIAEEQNS